MKLSLAGSVFRPFTLTRHQRHQRRLFLRAADWLAAIRPTNGRAVQIATEGGTLESAIPPVSVCILVRTATASSGHAAQPRYPLPNSLISSNPRQISNRALTPPRVSASLTKTSVQTPKPIFSVHLSLGLSLLLHTCLDVKRVSGRFSPGDAVRL